MIKKEMDQGQPFEWGKTSRDYGKYRDIYPESLYKKLNELGIGISGQTILDLGTGTGVLPRAMYADDIDFTGTDASKEQIEMAKELSKKEEKAIQFEAVDSENIAFKENTFDVVTSVQSWHYFDKPILLPKLRSILKPGGQLAIVFMYWLPHEDELVKASEALILKHNPYWTGGGVERVSLKAAQFPETSFRVKKLITFDADIPFSRETWLGRVRASRGIGATLSTEKINAFDQEHALLIARLRPQNFTVLHQITIEVYE